MKMTPRDKAFFEYGRARKILEIAKKQLFKELSWYSSRHQSRDYNHLDIYIRNAWKKRAACREMDRSHLCKECINLPTDKCKECKWEFHSTRLKMTKSLWEPRKEGE